LDAAALPTGLASANTCVLCLAAFAADLQSQVKKVTYSTTKQLPSQRLRGLLPILLLGERDTIVKCYQSLIYRIEPTSEKWKNRKTKK